MAELASFLRYNWEFMLDREGDGAHAHLYKAKHHVYQPILPKQQSAVPLYKKQEAPRMVG